MRNITVTFKEEVINGQRAISSSIEGHCDADFFLDVMWKMGRIFEENFLEVEEESEVE